MDTILDSRTSSGITDSSDVMNIKAASAPLYSVPKPEEANVKIQISAPSYLFSLKDNDAPPFKKPEHEAKPKLLIGTVMTEEEAVSMIAAADADNYNGLKKYLGNFLFDKKIVANYSLSERTFLVSLMTETIDYAAQRDFTAQKLACLITIYLGTHVYFKWYYWMSPVAVWLYFKETMMRHTIEDSPDGQDVFGPDECYDIETHFHTLYLSNLPLVHILTFGAYRLKLLWPFKLK